MQDTVKLRVSVKLTRYVLLYIVYVELSRYVGRLVWFWLTLLAWSLCV
jgi:hypothetical protein